MRLASLMAAVALFLGCEPQPAPRFFEEEQEYQENVPATKPPPPVGQSHKAEPEYDGKTLTYWLAESKSESAESRRAAAQALGNMGPTAVPVLNELIRDKDLGVRLAAAKALQQIRKEKK